MSNRKCAVVCGGGPSGLAAAIKLHQLGWQEIHLVERQEDIQSFDRGKAFNYQLDGRCLLYTSPSPRDRTRSRMPSSA